MTALTEPGAFPSWRSYWRFTQSVSREYRYLRSPETEAFLANVLTTSERRRVVIPAGRLFWRAQVGHDWRPMDEDSDEEVRSSASNSSILSTTQSFAGRALWRL